MLSRLTRRPRQSDFTPQDSEHSGSPTPALKGPVREDTRFGKIFRMEIGKLQSGWSALDTHATVMQSADSPTNSQMGPGEREHWRV